MDDREEMTVTLDDVAAAAWPLVRLLMAHELRAAGLSSAEHYADLSAAEKRVFRAIARVGLRSVGGPAGDLAQRLAAPTTN